VILNEETYSRKGILQSIAFFGDHSINDFVQSIIIHSERTDLGLLSQSLRSNKYNVTYDEANNFSIVSEDFDTLVKIDKDKISFKDQSRDYPLYLDNPIYSEFLIVR